MTQTPRYKTVKATVPGSEHIEITVNPWSSTRGEQGHSIGIMNRSTGNGRRIFDLDSAEAEAAAIVKAIRSYRRRNRDLLSGEGS